MFISLNVLKEQYSQKGKRNHYLFNSHVVLKLYAVLFIYLSILSSVFCAIIVHCDQLNKLATKKHC